MSFRDQFVPIPKDGRFRRTGLGAGRLLSILQASVAQNALSDVGHGGVPIVSRDVVWTGHHAIAATHAFRAVVHHRTERGLRKRSHGANGSTSRFETMAALLTGICMVRAFHYRRPVARRQSIFRVPVTRRIRREAIGLLASNRALIAADAFRGIGENCGPHLARTSFRSPVVAGFGVEDRALTAQTGRSA